MSLSAADYPPAITKGALERILSFLARFFLPATDGDPAAAREAASATLLTYGARTDPELRLAALTIAFSFGALDSLGQSVGANLPVNQVLRLRGNGNALHRSAERAEKKLDALRRQPPLSAPATPDPASTDPVSDITRDDLPAGAEPAELLAYARAVKTAAPPPQAPPRPLSRQARRHLEREAEKTRRRQQEQARLAERAALRSVHATTPMTAAQTHAPV